MSFRLRAAHPRDLEPLYEMAKLTGGGFTNVRPIARRWRTSSSGPKSPTRATKTRSPTSSSCWCWKSQGPAKCAALAS